ncbi:hypothetical protein BLOT_013339 [Blomia tropicalis]|nr:hypothetical protein BLOT_013339 [Blomia tropicalis]
MVTADLSTLTCSRNFNYNCIDDDDNVELSFLNDISTRPIVIGKRFSTLYSHCLVGRFGPDDNGPSSGNLNMTTTTMSGLLHISAFVLSSIYRTYKKNKRENEID